MEHAPIVRQFAAAVIDVNDLEREAAFWGRVIGGDPGPALSADGWLTAVSFTSSVFLAP